MKREEFSIGTVFYMGNGEWLCTDVGTRTVAAIEIDPDDDPSWRAGPPYAVTEFVIDEKDMPGCSAKPDVNAAEF